MNPGFLSCFFFLSLASFIVAILNFRSTEHRLGGREGGQVVGACDSRDGDACKKGNERKRGRRGKNTQARRQNASSCLQAVELLFEMKIQSV